jgi:hypothetical protein
LDINHEKILKKASIFFEKMDYENAGILCAQVFEKVIKELYLKAKEKMDETLLEKVICAEEKHKNNLKKNDLNKFSFGQLIRLCNDPDVNFRNLVKYNLNKDLKITNKINLSYLADIRNRLNHLNETDPILRLEAKHFYFSLMVILEEIEFFKDGIKCPNCESIVSRKCNFCFNCHTTLKTRCPNCENEVKVEAEICVKCGSHLYNLSDEEYQILKEHLDFLNKDNHTTCEKCKICGKIPEKIYSEPPDLMTGDTYSEYEYWCKCIPEIEEILKYRSIKRELKYKFVRSLDAITGRKIRPNYYLQFLIWDGRHT